MKIGLFETYGGGILGDWKKSGGLNIGLFAVGGILAEFESKVGGIVGNLKSPVGWILGYFEKCHQWVIWSLWAK